MIKYAANAFLATKISFANEMAQMCELFGADVRQVLPAIGADHRVGTAFLNAGVGWGGSCFGKDVAALIATGQEYGYTPSMLQATVEINQTQRASAVRKLQRELRMLKGRRIALLGLTFKPGTDDLRDAPALDIARRLLAAGAVVSAFDPVVKELPDEFERRPDDTRCLRRGRQGGRGRRDNRVAGVPRDRAADGCAGSCAATLCSTAATACRRPISSGRACGSSASAGKPAQLSWRTWGNGMTIEATLPTARVLQFSGRAVSSTPTRPEIDAKPQPTAPEARASTSLSAAGL